jgi:hypothetical protein
MVSPNTSPQYARHVEIITFGKEDPSNPEWVLVQLALDGRLAPEFSIHKADWRSYSSEESRMEMLTRQSVGLLDEFGDARHARIAA